MSEPTSHFEVRRLRPYSDTPLLVTESQKVARRHATQVAEDNFGETFGVLDADGAIILRVPQRPTRFRAVDRGGGVRAIQTEGPDRLALDTELPALCAKFGSELVANLLRVHAGANRFISLLHFLQLNTEHVTRESVAWERNFHFAALQILGVYREISIALGQLGNTGIKRHLTDTAPWTQLQRICKRWRQDAPTRLRNSVLFHLGFPDDTRAALEKKRHAGDRVLLIENDPNKNHMHSRFTGGEDLLLAASGLQLEELEDTIEDSLDDFDAFFTGLEVITRDLLKQCGARLD
jgi:hypothetical protein